MVILGLALAGMGILTLIGEGDYLFGGKTQGEVNEIVLSGDKDISDYLDDYVSIDVYGTLEIFAETKHTVNAIPTGTDYHYLVWLDDDSFMAVSVPKKREAEFEAQANEVWAFINGDLEEFPYEKPIQVEGKLERLTGELDQYYNECLQEIGVTEGEYEVRHYIVNGAESRGMTILTTILTTLVGLFFLFFAFGKFIFAKKNSKNINQGQGLVQPAEQPAWQPPQAGQSPAQNQVPQYSAPETAWQPGAPVQSHPAQPQPEQPSWQPAQPEQTQPSWQPAQSDQLTDLQDPIQPAEPADSGSEF